MHFSAVQTLLVSRFTEKLSRRLDTEVSIERVKYSFFDKLHLQGVEINDQSNDTLIYVKELTATIDDFSIRHKEIELESVLLSDCDINSKLNKDRESNFAFILEAFGKRDTLNSFLWNISCKNFELNNVLIVHYSENDENSSEIKLQDIQFEAHHFTLNPDSLYFEINDLKVYQSEDFKIENLSARFMNKRHLLRVSDFNIATEKSQIKDLNLSIDQSRLTTGDKMMKADISLNLGTTEISMHDLAHFIPIIEYPEGSFKIKGELTGRLDSIHGKNMQLYRGDKTSIDCDFFASGLPNFQEARYQLQLRQSSLEFDDLSGLMSTRLITSNDLLNQILKGVGVVRYDGSFDGTTRDFEAKGVFETNYGIVRGDLSFSPTNNKGIRAKGHINTSNFKVGKLLQNEQLGSTNFNGKVSAILNSKNKFVQAQVEGEIDSLTYNKYCYRNISLNGLVKPNLFEGELAINDKNLRLNFNGLANASQKNPEFAFALDCQQTDLKLLNFMSKYQQAKLAFHLDANFSGVDFAHLYGKVLLPEGYFITEYDTLSLDNIIIHSSIDSIKTLSVESDYIDYQMNGIYNYSELNKTMQNILHHYLPNIVEKPKQMELESNFDFTLRIKNMQPVLHTFLPTLAVSSGYVLGRVDEANSSLVINGQVGKILTPSFQVGQTNLTLESSNGIDIELKLHDALIGKQDVPLQFTLNSSLAQNVFSNQLIWEAVENKKNEGELIHQLDFNEDKSIKLTNYRSNFRLNDVLWQISPSTAVLTNEKTLTINGFMVNNSFQSFSLSGTASKEPTDVVKLKLNNIDLKNINPFLAQKHRFDGAMSGEVDFYSLLSNMYFVGDFNVSELVYNNELLGDISLVSNWDQKQEAIEAQIDIQQTQGKLYADAYFSPITDSLNVAVSAQKVSLNFLSPMLSGIFKNIEGFASGDIVFYGHKKKLLIDGDLMAEEAQIAINALNVNYHFDDTVKFRQDSIIFDRIRLYDDEGHTGSLDGSLKHTNFNNMLYDLTMNSSNLMIINTTSADNELFFGKAYGRGNVKITGKGTQVDIEGRATTLANTDISFVPMDAEKAEIYNFLSFVEHHEKEEVSIANLIIPQELQSKLDMKFNINITPEAKFQLVFNSKIGDVIQARGKGSMQVGIDQNFDISMFGDFEATWGDYLFTLQNIFNKRFAIEKGSTIKWAGDPLDANLNIKAIYNVKAPLSDLVANNYNGYDFTQRVPVSCYIILKEELSNPNISFDIKFPTVEDRIQEELRQYMSTEEDLNRQMLSLLLMGNFYTPEYLQGTYTGFGTTLMGTTTSELLSNQLSNWLSAISDNFDLGVNYRPGNDITDDEVELALSTQLFNNRVTINGNISNNVNTTGTTATNDNSAFVGDFDVLVALSRNGKLQMKVYNHSNNNIIYETSPYKQGVGVSYQEDFDTLSDLWRKIKRIFRRNSREYSPRREESNRQETDNPA